MSRSISRSVSGSNNAVVGATSSSDKGRTALVFLVGGLLGGSYLMYKGSIMLGAMVMGGSLLAGSYVEGA